jgi:hypothetical protein
MWKLFRSERNNSTAKEANFERDVFGISPRLFALVAAYRDSLLGKGGMNEEAATRSAAITRASAARWWRPVDHSG